MSVPKGITRAIPTHRNESVLGRVSGILRFYSSIPLLSKLHIRHSGIRAIVILGFVVSSNHDVR